MANMTTVEIKTFVPAKDFNLSKRFYQDVAFDLAWSDEHLAYCRHGSSSFLLQDFYNEVHASNFMMHLLVEDVDAWWRQVQDQGLPTKYGVHAEPPADRGSMRDFLLLDPTGVSWRVGQNLAKAGTSKQSADNR
jgi:uncharacterized glyoxalase superfamily protein PhnB